MMKSSRYEKDLKKKKKKKKKENNIIKDVT